MLRKGAQVLDVGCGPGFWASEMAHEYPNSHITGIDTVEPGIDRLVNFHFVNANVLLGVPFGDETFDYVFVRHLNFGILEGDWPRLLAELVRVLKPGGWLEVLETDMQLHRPGPHLERFSQKFMEIQRAKGVNPALARLLPSLFLTLPLSPVRKGYLSFPCGKTWAGKLGKLTMSDWQATVNVVARHVLDEENEAEQLLNECDEYKTFINSHIVIGRKKL
ncbi:hypothetical protein BZG36_04869 [Bifiguratus adelaidae]|uniref:Methyltransferase domain-containing protein n=1 Tax=Bifiguratus adelaidae TaxID=1938954 RepID=A0A261XUU3_9FUNG|nr:hypothetical protein BZG36_04869 [Bifiguratus adelaidae]